MHNLNILLKAYEFEFVPFLAIPNFSVWKKFNLTKQKINVLCSQCDKEQFNIVTLIRNTSDNGETSLFSVKSLILSYQICA